MKKILITNDILAVARGNEVLLQGHIIPENFNKDSLEELDEDDFDSIFDKNGEDPDVEFIINKDGSIAISKFNDFYQFNCCNLNHKLVLTIVEVYEKVLGIQKPDLHAAMSNPLSFRTKLFSDIVIEHKRFVNGYTVDHYFKFKFKNALSDGQNQLCTYSSFNVEIESLKTIEEVVDYYITINKMLAKACYDSKDDMYLSNSDWAKEFSIFLAHQFDDFI